MSYSKNSSFVGSVSKLAFSTATVQMLSIMAIPVTSRLFPPEAFGSMSFFMSISTIIASVSSLKYEIAVVLPKDDDEASHVLALGGIFTVLTTLLSAIVFLVMGRIIVRKCGVPELVPVVWVFPINIFFIGLTKLLQYWHMRLKSYGIIAAARIAGKTGQLGATIGFGLSGFSSAVYLVVSATFMPVVQTFLYGNFCLPSFVTFLKRRCTLSGLKKAAFEYRKFPLYTLWSDLLNITSQSLPFIFITAFFGAEANGHFSRALALVSMPLYFFSGSIGDVLYQRVSAMKASEEPYAGFIETVLIRLTTLVIPPMILLYSFVGVVTNGWIIAYLFPTINLSLKPIVKTALTASLSAIPPTLLTASAKWVFDFPPYAVLAVAAVTYSLLLVWSTSRDPELKSLLWRMIRMAE